MKSISMVEENLPAGFRFHPRDEELICDYLMNKLYDHSHNHNHNHKHSTLLIQVDLNKSEPWELPESACVGGKEWYFYSQRDRKYSTGLRTNRATSCGYWKATGKDRPVLSSKSKSKTIVGMRKTLVFYQGRAPKGTKTDWVMHEFRLEQPLPLKDKDKDKNKNKDDQEDWVLCRVFYKSREMGSNNINITATSSCGFSFNSLPVPALQVPCFSNLPPIPNQHVDLFFQPTPTPTPTPILMAHHDHTADNDNEVLKALLLNHMENDPNLECLGDPTSQTCLSQFHMLNHY